MEERERQRLSVIDRGDKLADAINAQLKTAPDPSARSR